MRLKNTTFSLITDDCIGGVISHDLHLPFRSPTIDLCFSEIDFLVFCEHLEYYLSLPVIEGHAQKPYPVGVLDGKYGPVHIRFMHYASFEEASRKWEERSRRVDFDNLYIIMDAAKCEESILERFDKLPFPNKIALTYGTHPNIKNSFPIDTHFYDDNFFQGKILTYPRFGLRRYLDVLITLVFSIKANALINPRSSI